MPLLRSSIWSLRSETLACEAPLSRLRRRNRTAAWKRRSAAIVRNQEQRNEAEEEKPPYTGYDGAAPPPFSAKAAGPLCDPGIASSGQAAGAAFRAHLRRRPAQPMR